MTDENKSIEQNLGKPNKEAPLREGYQPPLKKGYQPGTSNLNPSKPPQGGSGVPPKKSGETGGGKKE